MCFYSYSTLVPSSIQRRTWTLAHHRRVLCITYVSAKNGQEYWEVLLHAFSDSTTTFVSKRKVRAFKAFTKYPFLQDAFWALGSPELSSSATDNLEHYVCWIYGRSDNRDINQVRFDLLRQKFDTSWITAVMASYNGTELSLLPPCQSSLQMHTQQVHYQVLYSTAFKVILLLYSSFPGILR